MSNANKELQTVTEIRIDGKWVREEKLEPAFVKKVINDRIDFAMRNAGFVRKDKIDECKD